MYHCELPVSTMAGKDAVRGAPAPMAKPAGWKSQYPRDRAPLRTGVYTISPTNFAVSMNPKSKVPAARRFRPVQNTGLAREGRMLSNHVGCFLGRMLLRSLDPRPMRPSRAVSERNFWEMVVATSTAWLGTVREPMVTVSL